MRRWFDLPRGPLQQAAVIIIWWPCALTLVVAWWATRLLLSLLTFRWS